MSQITDRKRKKRKEKKIDSWRKHVESEERWCVLLVIIGVVCVLCDMLVTLLGYDGTMLLIPPVLFIFVGVIKAF